MKKCLMQRSVNSIVICIVLLSISACGNDNDKSSVNKYDKAYITSQRLCPEMFYKCLPEAKQFNRFKPKKDKDGQTMTNDVYQLSDREEHDIKQRKQQRIYKEVTQMLDLYFPEFWGDKPEQEQMQWVYEVHLKVIEYDKKHNYDSKERGTLELMATICAIVGIDFDTKPGHEPVATFLQNDKYSPNTRLSETVDYLRFVYLDKDYSLDGDFYSKWYLRAALRELPRPARRVPSLDDAPNNQINHQEHNIMGIYFGRIRGKGGQ